MNIKNIGDSIAKLRKEKGLSGQFLADMIGISAKTISKWKCEKAFPISIY